MDCSLNRFLETFQRVFKVKTFYNNTKTLSTFLGVLTCTDVAKAMLGKTAGTQI